jgi:uncharacterized protein YggE
LQAIGLTIGDLRWQVPPDRTAAALREATIYALTELRQEATAAANALGPQVQGYQLVDLAPAPMPVMSQARRAIRLQMAPAMPAPQATPDSQNITASVSADVVLRPAATPDQKEQHP